MASEALALDTNHAKSLVRRARACERLGENEAAIRDLKLVASGKDKDQVKAANALLRPIQANQSELGKKVKEEKKKAFATGFAGAIKDKDLPIGEPPGNFEGVPRYGWAMGLPPDGPRGKFAWLVDVYRLRLHDDSTVGYNEGQGGFLHGLYAKAHGEGDLISTDFLIFCKLCLRHGVVPNDFDWRHLLQTAKSSLLTKFTKSDAMSKWHTERKSKSTSPFSTSGKLGNRSLRATAEVVYGTPYDAVDDSEQVLEKMEEECDEWPFEGNGEAICRDIGGFHIWRDLAHCLGEDPKENDDDSTDLSSNDGQDEPQEPEGGIKSPYPDVSDPTATNTTTAQWQGKGWPKTSVADPKKQQQAAAAPPKQGPAPNPAPTQPPQSPFLDAEGKPLSEKALGKRPMYPRDSTQPSPELAPVGAVPPPPPTAPLPPPTGGNEEGEDGGEEEQYEDDDDDDETLRVNDRVIVRGLNGRPELNDSLATVLFPLDAKSGRVAVRVRRQEDDDDENEDTLPKCLLDDVKLKPDNLQKLPIPTVEPHDAMIHPLHKGGFHSLHIAAMEGRIDEIDECVEDGVDPDIFDEEGQTPLMRACEHGQLEAVHVLLMNGATPGVTAKRTMSTALHSACMRGPSHLPRSTDKYDAAKQVELVKALLEYGAQVDLKNAKGKTPVMNARQVGAFDVVALLRWDRNQGARRVEKEAA